MSSTKENTRPAATELHPTDGFTSLNGGPREVFGRLGMHSRDVSNVSVAYDISRAPSAASSRPVTPNTLNKYKHAFAVHSRNRITCLSRESREQVSFTGFKNLAFSILFCMVLRLMVENFKKYGIRVTITSSAGLSENDLFYGIWLYLTIPVHFFIAFFIEKLAAGYAMGAVGRVKKAESENKEAQMDLERRKLTTAWRTIAFLHAINITFNLLYSSVVVYFLIDNPGIGTLCELHAVIVWLKVLSYALTNRDLRHALLKPSPTATVLSPLYKEMPYPKNITLSNLCYFWWAPTLVYQPVYPRADKIRWIFILQRLGEMLICFFIIWVASAQYAVPLLQNSLADISKLDMMGIFERVLKLSTISTICWLAGFYAMFQAGLNALAELMRFGDREFYSDWWNCSDVRSYWTSWNKPVSSYMKRHVYTPLIARGMGQTMAATITFLFSAILHEVLVGVPTHNIIGVAFAGMAFQIPLIILTDRFRRIKGYYGQLIGNLIFWSSFCLVGQPLAALSYYFAWQAKYGNARPDYPTLWHWSESSPRA